MPVDFENIKYIIFDWGGTLMVDQPFAGPMVSWNKVDPIPGAVDTLRELTQRGYRCFIGTNASASTGEQVFQALERVGLHTYIEDCYTAREVGYQKPECDFYHHILKDIGAKPEQVLMVGDSFSNDVLGSVAAGLWALWFNPENEVKKEGERYQTIHQLPELITLLASFDLMTSCE